MYPGGGVEISGKVAATLSDIVTKARQVDELAAAVATASSEQTEGISQVTAAVGQMDKITQSNAANAEESAAAAEELNGQAHTMREVVTHLLELVETDEEIKAASNPAKNLQAEPPVRLAVEMSESVLAPGRPRG